MKKVHSRKRDPALVWEKVLVKPQRSRGALSTQLVTSFIDAIDSKHIPEGVRLPSSRSIAESLGIGRNTAIAAIDSLIEQGYLVSKDRSGVFVAVGKHSDPAFTPKTSLGSSFNWIDRLGLATPLIEHTSSNIPAKQITHDFKYGQFDLTTFPTNHWRQCERSASGLMEIAEWGKDAVDRDDVELIESLRRHILPSHGIWAEPDEILVTLGGQEGRYLVAQLLSKAGTTVGIENPGLPDMNAIVSATPARRVYLPVDHAGTCLSAELKQCDVAFIMPSHHCPTTAVMPYERRLALLDLAERRDMILVEDTYETELLSYAKMIPSVKSLDRKGRVIHIGSLSKSVAPGLRIGFVVASRTAISELRAIRRLIHRHPPGNVQRALAMFIDRGYYHSYLRRISGILANRTKALDRSLARWLPQARAYHCDGASSYWVELPESTDALSLSTELQKKGVLVEAGDRFFFDAIRKNYLRIAVSQVPAEKVESGVQMIARSL